MAETRGSIVCRLCGEGILVTFHRVHGNGVHLAVADQRPLAEHYQACPGVGAGAAAAEGSAAAPVPVGPSRAELAGRIGQFLDGRHYVATGGSRSCTMCGMSGVTCLAIVGQNTREPCCRACRDGNTHPAPGEAQGNCRQWSEAREAEQ